MSSLQSKDREIQEALRRNRRVSEHLIDFRRRGRRVELRGRVASFREKLEAERVVGAELGRESIVNNLLEVHPRRPETDRGIARQVRAQLRAADALSSETLTVDVKGGRAVLRGTVSTRRQRRLAADVAVGAPGVKRIVNLVRVDPREHTLDHAASAEILRRLEQDERLAECYLHVAVSGDTAVLSGYARTKRQRRRAGEIARRSRIPRVRNEITVTRRSRSRSPHH